MERSAYIFLPGEVLELLQNLISGSEAEFSTLLQLLVRSETLRGKVNRAKRFRTKARRTDRVETTNIIDETLAAAGHSWAIEYQQATLADDCDAFNQI